MSSAIDNMVKSMNGLMTKSLIKAAITKFVPKEAKPHIPKLIDALNIGVSELSNYLGNDDKFLLLRKDGSGKLWYIVVDTKKPFMVSKDENYFEAVKCVELNEMVKGLIEEYILPHVPQDNLSDIGKLDMNGFSTFAEQAMVDLNKEEDFKAI